MSEREDRERPLALAADDDADILELVSFRLSQTGCDVLEATDGQRALELALERQPDICVLDLKMPKLDGFSVTREIRASPGGGRVKILLLTASAEEADVERAKEVGVDAFLRKPFNPDQLKAFVATALERLSAD